MRLTGPLAMMRRFGGLRFGAGAVRGQRDEAVQQMIQRLDAGEICLGQFHWRQFSSFDQFRGLGDGEKFQVLHGFILPPVEFRRDEYMRRLIAARPPGGEAVDHAPDMAICLDQFRQIFRWQIEPGLASEQNDFVVGWRCCHGETPGFHGLVIASWTGLWQVCSRGCLRSKQDRCQARAAVQSHVISN